MFNWNKYLLIVFYSSLLSQTLLSQIAFQGIVTDNGGEFLGNGSEPVENALVTLINQSDTTRSYNDYTDMKGQFEIIISNAGIDDSSLNPNSFQLLQNYPNPFNPTTVIGYKLSHPCHVKIEVFNITGQKIKTLLNHSQNTSGSVIWDGTNDQGKLVSAGLYIYTMQSKGIQINRKMLLIDGGSTGINTTAIHRNQPNSVIKTVSKNLVSDQYILKITGDNISAYEELVEINGNTTRDITVQRVVIGNDGKIYKTVKIGNQWWMAENLKETQYRNGDAIPEVTNNTTWDSVGVGISIGARCAYNNDENNESHTYGYLYNWYAVDDPRNIAPTGWHVPTDEEWKELVMALGMSQSEADAHGGISGTNEGSKLAGRADLWYDGYLRKNVAFAESGFSAIPGGYRHHGGNYFNIRSHAFFWSATEGGPRDGVWMRAVRYSNSGVYRQIYYMEDGFSMRLVRD